MIGNRGQTETPSFTLGLIISLLLLLALGIIGYQIAQKNVDVRAQVAFSDFLEYYQNCTAYQTTNCYCEPFDFSLSPQAYSLRANDLEGNLLGFQLLKDEKVKYAVEVPGEKLCSYTYSSANKIFALQPVTSYTPSLQRMFTAPTITNIILKNRGRIEPVPLILLKSPKQTCFVAFSLWPYQPLSYGLDALRQKYVPCSSLSHNKIQTPLTAEESEPLFEQPQTI